MHIEFDPRKSERNRIERGLPFEDAAGFDFDTALVRLDSRREYGELRYVAIGWLTRRLHVVCFTETFDGIRVISLRRANEREVRRHAKVQAAD